LHREAAESVQNSEIDVIVFGYGPITQRLIQKLRQSNISVICVTNDEHSQRALNSIEDIRFYSRSDIVNTKLTSKTAIFSWRDANPLLNNTQGIQNWLYSDRFNTSRSFLLSSASVYQDCLHAQGEADVNFKITSDRSEKYFLEKSLSAIFHQKKVNHMNLRISNAYGPGLEYGFIGSAVNSILSGSPIHIFEKLNIVRDYIAVSDVIYAISELTKIGSQESAVNLSTGIGTSISEVLELFATYGYFFENQILKTAPKDLRYSVTLSPNLLSSMIDWHPISLTDGIRNLMKNKLI
jgi:nucleoside-diphosphate-sugar epimerase